MTISKNEFKIIYNHMKSISPLEKIDLIKQAGQSHTSNSEINNLITKYTSEKVVKLMRKINNFMLGGSDNASDGNSATSSAIPNTITDSATSIDNNIDLIKDATREINNIDSIKESIREIIEKLKTKSDLLKEKEAYLLAKENEIKTKEETLNKLGSNTEKLQKIKDQLITDINVTNQIPPLPTEPVKQIKINIGELQGGNTDTESGFISEIFN